MLFNSMNYIGIDPTAGRRPITYAALDNELKLQALGKGNIDEVVAYAAGQQQAIVAICAPRQPNQGLMKNPEIRSQLSPVPSPGRWMNFRLCEYYLRLHNFRIPRTPGIGEKTPNWMRVSFALFEKLTGLGYRIFPEKDAQRQCIEVYPHACFTVLLGIIPFNKQTLEGRLQRQLVLHEAQIHIPDPMRIFEEITRYRLLKGILTLDDLYTPAELDAIVGAFTAWFTVNRPSEVLRIGDPEEGEIILPVKELKQRYH